MLLLIKILKNVKDSQHHLLKSNKSHMLTKSDFMKLKTIKLIMSHKLSRPLSHLPWSSPILQFHSHKTEHES